MKKHGLTITHIREESEPFTVPVRALHITELQQISKEKPFDLTRVCLHQVIRHRLGDDDDQAVHP